MRESRGMTTAQRIPTVQPRDTPEIHTAKLAVEAELTIQNPLPSHINTLSGHANLQRRTGPSLFAAPPRPRTTITILTATSPATWSIFHFAMPVSDDGWECSAQPRSHPGPMRYWEISNFDARTAAAAFTPTGRRQTESVRDTVHGMVVL